MYLSKSAYGNKRSALHHLFRLHNKRGWPPGFKDELDNLYTVFFRQLAKQSRGPADVTTPAQAQAPVDDADLDQDIGIDDPTPHQCAAHKRGRT